MGLSQKFGASLSFVGTRKRTIPLPFSTARVLASGDIPNTATIGGLLTSNTAPALACTSTVDPSLNLTWAAGSTTTIHLSTMSPVDLDVSRPVVVKLAARRAGNTDTCVMHVGFYEGIGASDKLTGTLGNTSNLGTSVSTTTFAMTSMAATNNTPLQWNLVVSPAQAHGSDAIVVTGVWIEYPSMT